MSVPTLPPPSLVVDSTDDTHFSSSTMLRDGRPVTIRLMSPDDKEKLVANPRVQARRATTAQSAMAERIGDLVSAPAGKAPRLDGVRKTTAVQA
jgi:hypothetical protein